MKDLGIFFFYKIKTSTKHNNQQIIHLLQEINHMEWMLGDAFSPDHRQSSKITTPKLEP